MNWRDRYILRRLALLLVLISGAVSAETDELSIFYAEDIKAAMQVHLEKTLDEDGVFHLVDDVTGEALRPERLARNVIHEVKYSILIQRLF